MNYVYQPVILTIEMSRCILEPNDEVNERTFAEFRMRLGARHDLVGSAFARHFAICRVVRVDRRRRRAFTRAGTQQPTQHEQRQQRH